MPEIKFDIGLVTYNLNGKCEVTFNPADSEFMECFYNAFDALGTIHDEYSKRISGDAPTDAFSLARERDGKMRQTIDDLFDVPVYAAAFGTVSPCAFASGFPVWLNFMLSVADEIMANLDDVEKQIDPRVAKYTSKYKKYAAKYHKK